MSKITKRLKLRDEGVDFSKVYSVPQALELLQERASKKFDETVEAVFKCHLDARKEGVRASVILPHGTGKKVTVAVFAEGDEAKAARDAGADIVGAQDLIDQVVAGQIHFQSCVATPAMIPLLSRTVAKILGPKKLMPNPKLGTVTADVAKVVKEIKFGKASVCNEKAGIVHSVIGKVSFSLNHLEENFMALYHELLRLKPETVKSVFVKEILLSTTMGFALPVAAQS